MHPVTHLLLSWTVADAVRLQPRDRSLVVWCGVLPDLDGLGVVADISNAFFNPTSTTSYYHQFHHFLCHGLLAALLIPVVLGWWARERGRVWWWGLLVFHLHLLCDLAGSRGPSPTDLWPIYYLAPLSRHPMLVWNGQWRLDGWPNLALTILLLVWVIVRAMRCGCSPLGLFNAKADQAVVATLRRRWGTTRS